MSQVYGQRAEYLMNLKSFVNRTETVDCCTSLLKAHPQFSMSLPLCVCEKEREQ